VGEEQTSTEAESMPSRGGASATRSAGVFQVRRSGENKEAELPRWKASWGREGSCRSNRANGREIGCERDSMPSVNAARAAAAARSAASVEPARTASHSSTSRHESRRC
jgi:hypothetical protein